MHYCGIPQNNIHKQQRRSYMEDKEVKEDKEENFRNEYEGSDPAKNVNVNPYDNSLSDPSFNYNDYILDASLEPEIFESHQKYVDDYSKHYHMGGSPSLKSVKSGDNFATPWLGLRRPRTDFKVADESRQVYSSDNDQFTYGGKNTKYCDDPYALF
jgi:hypothetical protein